MFWCNPQLKSCGSIEGSCKMPMTLSMPNRNPQLKSCGSIEGSCKMPMTLSMPNRNPQLKSCGSIEGTLFSSWVILVHKQSATEKLRLHWRAAKNVMREWSNLQSATEKLRLHWRHCVFYFTVNIYSNPQLKSCGSIEGDCKIKRVGILSINPQLKSCGSIEGSQDSPPVYDVVDNPQLKSCGSIEGLAKWSIALTVFSSIRNWKVAAPLKVEISGIGAVWLVCNPQLKSCGSIEGLINRTWY